MNLSHERFVRVLACLKEDDGVAIDNRQHPRVPLRSTVLIAPFENGKVGPVMSARLQDISSGGVALHAFQHFPSGLQFVIELPETPENVAEGHPPVFRILARTVHCKQVTEHQYQAGLQFVRVWTAAVPALDAARAAA